MTARRNAHLASIAFLTTFAVMVAFTCLVFYVPKLIDRWKDYHLVLSPWKISLVDISRAAVNNGWMALPIYGAFVAALAWRLVAAIELRKSANSRGFEAGPRSS